LDPVRLSAGREFHKIVARFYFSSFQALEAILLAEIENSDLFRAPGFVIIKKKGFK
jgi:hypothetical protein